MAPTSVRHQWDFRAHRAAGVAAVALRASSTTSSKTQDLVYKFDIRGKAPRLSRLLQVGRGDQPAGGGTSGGDIRMDFGSVAVFADGRVAVSFIDSTTTWTSPGTTSDPTGDPTRTFGTGSPLGPAIAIEGNTELVRPDSQAAASGAGPSRPTATAATAGRLPATGMLPGLGAMGLLLAASGWFIRHNRRSRAA